MAESDAPFDRWHKKYPKPGDMPCKCGTKKSPLYASTDHGRGQQWQARYTDPNGKVRRPAFDTWQGAREHLDEVRVQIRNGSWVNPDLGNETVEFYAQEFLERRRKKNKNKNTTDTYDTHIRVHIIPFLGKYIARTLRRKHSMALVDYLIDQPTVGSVYGVQIFKTWRILVNYMIDEDVPLPANVVSRVELPEVDGRVKVSLSAEQVARLATAMREVEPRFEIFVWIAACAGLREGEAIGLRKTSIDWSEGLLYIEEQRQSGKSAKLKTKASAATLPVDAFLIDRLRKHIERFPQFAPVSHRAEGDHAAPRLGSASGRETDRHQPVRAYRFRAETSTRSGVPPSGWPGCRRRRGSMTSSTSTRLSLARRVSTTRRRFRLSAGMQGSLRHGRPTPTRRGLWRAWPSRPSAGCLSHWTRPGNKRPDDESEKGT